MPSEIELVKRAQSGERTAFEALFGLHVRQVQQTAYLICGDQRTAEELMQDSFTQAFRTIHQLREPDAFAGWLYRITVRLAQRAAKRRRNERTATAQLATITPASLDSPADEAERRQLLWAAIQGLPERLRTAIVLHYYQDRPLLEIAALMDAPPGTVKSWLHRARASLAAALREPLFADGGDL